LEDDRSCSILESFAILNAEKSDSIMNAKLSLPKERIEEFCLRWKIVEFSLFGSVLRDDFDHDSDVDILVSLSGDADLDLYDWITMIEELEEIFGREVDLVEKSTLRNPFRRMAILTNREIIYAS
jgi:predicted nucleotidyltransferase